MNLQRLAGKILSAGYILQSKIFPSFSQAGEDQVIRYLFQNLGIENPNYIDIGTNHPYIGNNTYLFYIRGSKGVCVEPDPAWCEKIRKHRRRDVILNVGIGATASSVSEFYVFPDPYTGWNTFSFDEASQREKETGIRIKTVRKIPLLSINEVIERHFPTWPNLISIDIEGLDLEVLQSFDFEKYRPEVFCVETITFSMNRKEEKITSIADYLHSKGYFTFGDTHINTIFCREDVYKGDKL